MSKQRAETIGNGTIQFKESAMTRIRSCIMMAAILLAPITLAPASASDPETSQKQVGQMNNAFASDLYAQLAAKPGNLFFSPTSIQTAMAMTWAGARGQTADEMAKALRLEPGPQ